MFSTLYLMVLRKYEEEILTRQNEKESGAEADGEKKLTRILLMLIW